MKQWLIKTGIVTMCVLSVFISCSSDDDDDDDPNWAILIFQRHHQQIENDVHLSSDILAVLNNSLTADHTKPATNDY